MSKTIEDAIAGLHATQANATQQPGVWFVAFVGGIRHAQKILKEAKQAGFEAVVAPHNMMPSWRTVSIRWPASGAD